MYVHPYIHGWRPCLGALLLSFGLGACGGADDAAPAPYPGLPVQVVVATPAAVEVLEQSIGRIEAPRIPAVAAETTGRVRTIRVDAGVRIAAGDLLAEIDDEAQRLAVESAQATVTRLEVLLENQQRTVSRLEKLALERSASQAMLDDSVAEARALRAQIAEASARRQEASRALTNTRVVSPIDGVVQAKRVSEGDFVTIGQPMFELVGFEQMRAYLPFPETLSGRIRPGQPVRLSLPTRDTELVTAVINEIRPTVGQASKSIEAIVEFDNTGAWFPGASVRGQVVVAERDASIVVPESSIVQRPAGMVVYVVEDGIAHQRPVVTGVRRDGRVEIREGIVEGEQVVTDGAGFLTDGATVRIQDR